MDNYEQLASEILSLEVDFNNAKAYADELYARAREVEQKLKCKRVEMVNSMQQDGVLSHKINGFVFSIAKSPVRVVVPNEQAVPEDFIDLKPVINKTRIKEFLKQNGGADWASLEQDNEYNLRVKIEG